MWNSDNAIFNVNGVGLERLKKTLSLALENNTVEGWKFKKEKGICLYQYDSTSKKDIQKFPVPLKAETVAELVFEWLKGDEAKTTTLQGWDIDADHDGSNELGWRAYTEDWGHVDGDWNVLAVKPAYMWYGK
jgi:hypothetical protein